MNKNNKGFTLVELLATIVVITLVMGIAIPYVMNVINNSKNNSRELAINNIKTSAKYYAEDNSNEMIWTHERDDANNELENTYTCVSVTDLINKGYLKSSDIKNELNITNADNIVVKRNSGGVIYNEEIDNNICKNRPNVVPIPTNKFCSQIEYSGEVQNLIKKEYQEEDGRYIYTNNEQIDAGTYIIKASLNNTNYTGLYWEDGTKGTKEVSCSIRKAIPKIVIDPEGGDGDVMTPSTAIITSNISGKITLKSSNTGQAEAKVEGNTITKEHQKQHLDNTHTKMVIREVNKNVLKRIIQH